MKKEKNRMKEETERKSNCVIYSTQSICKFVHREPVHSNTLNSLDNPAKKTATLSYSPPL
jgi:hypothetical protein